MPNATSRLCHSSRANMRADPPAPLAAVGSIRAGRRRGGAIQYPYASVSFGPPRSGKTHASLHFTVRCRRRCRDPLDDCGRNLANLRRCPPVVVEFV
uniref:Uncharacterized protein n=1 Tax=uncultured marine virus TaxID=186617 RepID=A0A0F7L688_9VIRU|nr:hypothetical protein [uncultured marine virus]